MRIFLAALVLLAPLSASANGGKGHDEFTQHKTDSFFKVTENKQFSIEILLDGNRLAVGANRGEIFIHDKHDKDVKGAVITLTPWRLESVQGAADSALIKEDEGFFGSSYIIENLFIEEAGHWELRVEVEKDGASDRAVFDFPEVGGGGGQ